MNTSKQNDYLSTSGLHCEHLYNGEIGYPVQREGDQFISLMPWSPLSGKQQSRQQPQDLPHQFMQSITNHQLPARPSLQPHFQQVAHLKCLSLYPTSESSPTHSLHSSVGPDMHPQSAPSFLETFDVSDEWQQSSGHSVTYMSYSPNDPSSFPREPHFSQNPCPQLPRKLPSSPPINAYTQPTDFFGAATVDAVPQQPFALHHHHHHPHQSVSPLYYESVSHDASVGNLSRSSPRNSPASCAAYSEEFSCDPRSVTQMEGEFVAETAQPTELARQVKLANHHQRLFSNRATVSPLPNDEIHTPDGVFHGTDHLDVPLSTSSGIASRTSSQSSVSEEDDDDADDGDLDYDPRDTDYVYRCRPSERLACPRYGGERNLQLRSTVVRYTPYAISPTSEAHQGAYGTRGHSSPSNASSISSISSTGESSSSGYPPTPTSPSPTRSNVRQVNAIPVPVPVPHLTKKSRGRRVPTAETLDAVRGPGSVHFGLDNGEFGDDSNPVSAYKGTRGITGGRKGAAKGVRMFTCKVPGCGKCFARGEHLKRHVRSIHTNEKPHRCQYPGCGKEFSRHDNLGQHTRVHKGWVPPARK